MIFKTAVLMDYSYADENDPDNLILAMPINIYILELTSYLFPRDTSYQYIKQFHNTLEGATTFVFDSYILNKYGHIIKESSVILKNEKYNRTLYNKLIKINNDTFLDLRHLSSSDIFTIRDSFNLEFSLLDKNMNIIRDMNITDKIPTAYEYKLSYVDNNLFVVEGTDFMNVDSQDVKLLNYSIFDHEGNLLEKIFLKDEDNNPINIRSAIVTKYPDNKGILLIGEGYGLKNDDFSYLNFYKSSGYGNFKLLKSLKIIPGSHRIIPQKITQLKNGDYILECIDFNNNYKHIIANPQANVIVYFPAKDLGIKTKVKEVKIRKKSFNIFPSPSSKVINIYFETSFFGKINIFDAYGRNVYIKNIVNKSLLRIDILLFPSNIYFINAIDASGHNIYKTKMFVKE